VKRFIVVTAALAVFAGVVARQADGQQENPQQVVMRSKLDHSQKLLESIVLEDFASMAKHSQELSLLSLAASWQVLQTPEYVQQSLEFRRAADAVHNAAEKKNLDGAALAYVAMTLKCVHCHKYVRGVRMAAAEPRERQLSLGQLAGPAAPPSKLRKER
jgi:hypothetical protein